MVNASNDAGNTMYRRNNVKSFQFRRLEENVHEYFTSDVAIPRK